MREGISSRPEPFWVILEFQFAWVLDFCLYPKKLEIQYFFAVGPHLPTAPGAFLNCTSQNILILIEIEPLELDMQCWYSYLMLFGEGDIHDLENCIRLLQIFKIFCNFLLKRKIITL